ncbi:MAG: 50S ribosomal protein L22 [Anaerolineales bacterium]
MDVKAQARYVGISAQKARLVVDMVRGQNAQAALNLLKFTPKVAARHVYKVVHTAIANAEENFGLNGSELIIKKAFVDEAPTRKWRRFGARGRFKPLLRRSAHITIVVAEKEGAAA